MTDTKAPELTIVPSPTRPRTQSVAIGEDKVKVSSHLTVMIAIHSKETHSDQILSTIYNDLLHKNVKERKAKILRDCHIHNKIIVELMFDNDKSYHDWKESQFITFEKLTIMSLAPPEFKLLNRLNFS